MEQTIETRTASLAEEVAKSRGQILAELRKVIVGQDEVVDEVLMALFCGGHCLITGVPGLAKTLLVKTLAQILHLSFKRIQFTPDLMPADITGTEVLDEEAGHRILRLSVLSWEPGKGEKPGTWAPSRIGYFDVDAVVPPAVGPLPAFVPSTTAVGAICLTRPDDSGDPDTEPEIKLELRVRWQDGQVFGPFPERWEIQ